MLLEQRKCLSEVVSLFTKDMLLMQQNYIMLTLITKCLLIALRLR